MTVHLLKEQASKEVTAKCGRKFDKTKNADSGTIWWTRVDCGACLSAMKSDTDKKENPQ